VSERDPNQTAVEPTANFAPNEAHQRHHAYLVVISGGKLGQRVLLSDRVCLIGRARSADFCTEADSVSRHHARIEWEDQGHIVTDLESTNGTFVNEHRVTSQLLQDGDRLAIGKLLLKYLKGGGIESDYHAELQRLARHDGLTGCYNRRHFDEALRRQAEGDQPSCLILFDLDNFKRVNDTYGHVSGDSVLCQLVARLNSELDSGLLLARIGGEEFAVLCPQTTLAAAGALAERLRSSVAAQAFPCQSQELAVTISVGVAERQPGEASEGWLNRADMKLYAAKRGGRNLVST
jgi:two-component system, cell cycle response regulator